MITMKKTIFNYVQKYNTYVFCYENYQKNFSIFIEDEIEDGKELYNFYLFNSKNKRKDFMFGLMKKDIEKYSCGKEAVLKCIAENNFNTYLKLYKEDNPKKYDISLYIWDNNNGKWEEDTRVRTNSAEYAYKKLVEMQYDEGGAILQRYYGPLIYKNNKTKINGWYMDYDKKTNQLTII